MLEYRAKNALYKTHASISQNSTAIAFLGTIYYASDNKIQDFSKALCCYRKVVVVNRSFSIRGIDLLYEHGDGVIQSYQESLGYYKQPESMKNKGSYYNIAILYYYGKRVPKDFNIGLKWFHQIIQEPPREDYSYVLVKEETEVIHDPYINASNKYIVVNEYMLYGETHYYLGVMCAQGQSQDEAIGHFTTASEFGVKEAEKCLKSIKNGFQMKKVPENYTPNEQNLVDIQNKRHVLKLFYPHLQSVSSP